MKFGSLTYLALVSSVLCIGGGITAQAKDPTPERKRSVHEEVILESISEQSIVIVGCLFAIELKELSPEKYEAISEYAVVKVFQGKLEFGAKIKVRSFVEGALKDAPAIDKSILGDFRFFVLYDQPVTAHPFEAAHSLPLPYSKAFEEDVRRLLQSKK